jgi:hypothetical protein
MPIPFRTDHRVICLALFLTVAPNVALRAQDAVARSAQPAVCTANGVLDLNKARELRDIITGPGISADRLVELRENLDASISLCESVLNAATATFLAGLYENIGESFSSLHSYEQASNSCISAELLFSRFPHPDVLWLHTLQVHAWSEQLRGNKGDAELLASKQSTLARDWVREGRFPIQELRFALAFEADLCDKSGNRQCSRDANLDVLTVRISEDGVCHFLDASTSCDQLGQYLLTKHLAQNGRIYIAVDRSSKYELVAATLESLRGTGFKIGFVNYDASSSQ